MSFANLWYLAFFAPLALVAWRLLRRSRRAGLRFSAVPRLKAASSGWRTVAVKSAPYLLLAGLSLVILALARPRTRLAHDRRTVNSIAIAMTVDISQSMEGLDLTPPGVNFSKDTMRIAVVKKLFAEFVDRRPDDLIGLVTFGGYATTRVPLTADHEALVKVLKAVEIPRDSDEGLTAIGDGLAMAIARLKDAKPKTKIVILLSDGMNRTGAVQPAEAAALAAKLGIKVYAIGIGSKSVRTPYIVQDMFGRRVEYADTTYDERQLKSIAETTKGRYFPVSDREALASALEEIDQLEKTELEADVYERWDEHFALFLVWGALLTIAAVTLSVSATRRMA